MFEWKYPALWKTEIPLKASFYITLFCKISIFLRVTFHDISMLLSMRDRWDQSEHEDEGDFGKAQTALYPSVGRLPGQQTNMQVRTVQ